MARIQSLKQGIRKKISVHDNTEATYYILDFPTGEKMLQIDSYGRDSRQNPGKISQTVQFSPRAIKQLKKILEQF